MTVIASRETDPTVAIFHPMVNSRAELEGEVIADQAMVMTFTTVLAINRPEQQALFPTPAIPIAQLGQTEGLLNNQAILRVR